MSDFRDNLKTRDKRRCLQESADNIQECPPGWVEEIKTNNLYQKIQRELSLSLDTEAGAASRNQ